MVLHKTKCDMEELQATHASQLGSLQEVIKRQHNQINDLRKVNGSLLDKLSLQKKESSNLQA
eukprot:999805-Karenia_brevis.AAC.1